MIDWPIKTATIPKQTSIQILRLKKVENIPKLQMISQQK